MARQVRAEQTRATMQLMWSWHVIAALLFMAAGLGHIYLKRHLRGIAFFVLIIVGVIWLLMLWVDMFRGTLRPENSLRLEIAGLYWHFVDIVWIAIFTLIYLME